MNVSETVSATAYTTAHETEKSVAPHLETTQIHIKAILAATDLSEQAGTALKYAARMAKQLHSKLHVVYAVTPEIYLADTTMISAELQKIDMERAQQELHEYTRKIPEVRSTLHEEIALCGPTPDVIREMVETAGIDLVVMGSHGRGAIGKLVLGSVAEAVIRQIHCPVLVAGPHCETRYGPMRSIVLATDLPATSLRAAQYATSLARESNAVLTVVHVISGKTGLSAATAKQSAQRDLRELVPHDTEFRRHVHFQVPSGAAADEIIRIAKHSRADMLVMGAHEDKALADHAPWATLAHVIREAPCPVLAVQPHIA